MQYESTCHLAKLRKDKSCIFLSKGFHVSSSAPLRRQNCQETHAFQGPWCSIWPAVPAWQPDPGNLASGLRDHAFVQDKMKLSKGTASFIPSEYRLKIGFEKR